MILTEALLSVTGLLDGPDRSDITAMRGVTQRLRADLLATLDLEDQGRLYVNDQKSGFFEALSREPDYEAWALLLEKKLGPELAADYQVKHDAARGALLDLHPKTLIDSIVGPIVVENDQESENQWLLEVDTVQTADRIIKDLAAGALLTEQVAIFQASYPELYAYLMQELLDELANRRAKDMEWLPAPWLEDSLRVLLQMPLDAQVELQDAKPPAPPPASGGKSKLNFKELRTAGQGGSGATG